MVVSFTIPTEPTGKARARTVRAGGVTRTYTPKETVVYENLVRLCYQQEAKGAYFEGAVIVAVTAFYAVPKSASRKKRQQMLGDEILPTKKPDCDNIAKAICDALNGLAYKDDSQIAFLAVCKMYAEMPHTRVIIMDAKDGKEEYIEVCPTIGRTS